MEYIRTSIIGLVVILTFAILFTINNKLVDSSPKSNWEWSDDWNSVNLDQEIINQPINTPPNLKISNFSEAKSFAATSNKQILLLVGASWCKWCEKMDKETLSDSKVKNILTNFIVLKVDADNDSDGIIKKFQINGLPTSIITNANEFKIKSKSGFMNANDFANWLK